MSFDYFIRWIAPKFGSWLYDLRHDFVDQQIREGHYCHFCQTFQLDLNHQSRVMAMQYPDCSVL